MDILREYIHIILEAAYSPQNLSNDMYINVNIKESYISVTLVKKDKNLGHVAAIRDLNMCEGAWQVNNANAPHGWGPMLYDVAMELATIYGDKGITTDRYEMSDDALAIWDHYLYNRNDVEKIEMEFEDPIEGDENCPMPYVPEYDGTSEHPSWFRYKKAPTIIKLLKKVGKYKEIAKST